ncbi:MAG: hypothetical protein Roseis2KO_32870 [Roseivirga sp.]
MIEYVKGDFFDFEADIRVNTVNCVGVMGAGAALQFKKKYPAMFKDYAQACKQGKVKIGEPHLWRENEMFKDESVTIINLPTKKHWKNPSEYSYVEAGLKWLKKFLLDKPSSTITLPALGCGHGGLDWNKVRPMIKDYLADLDTTILVFEPKSSTDYDGSKVNDDTLLEKGILRICPNDNNFPKRLNNRAVDCIYLKSKKSVFDGKLLSLIVDSKADEREKSAVLKCIEVFPRNGITYFLGYGSSFETDVAKELLAKKASILLALPYGIGELKVRKDLKEYWDENLVSLISLNSYNKKWQINQSIEALKLRISLSDALLIANHKLQSISKFESDLSNSFGFIFYINYWNETKDFYDRISAKKIGRDRDTHQPNIQPIFNLLESNEYVSQ